MTATYKNRQIPAAKMLPNFSGISGGQYAIRRIGEHGRGLDIWTPMPLNKEQRFEALLEITAALISRSVSLLPADQMVTTAETYVDAIAERV